MRAKMIVALLLTGAGWLTAFTASELVQAAGRGGGGRGGGGGSRGGGGGSRGGGGGGARSAPRPAPRPSAPTASRPKAPAPRPSGGASRPGGAGGARPPGGGGARPPAKPSVGTRPAVPNQRPSNSRPASPKPVNPGTKPAPKPGNGFQPGMGATRPPKPTTKPAPGVGVNRPGNGNSGNRPSVGDKPGRPSQLPADRPSIGQRPGIPPGGASGIVGNRPGGVGRPGTRPTNPIAGRPGYGNRPTNPIADRPGNRPGHRPGQLPNGGWNSLIDNNHFGDNYFNNSRSGYGGWAAAGMWDHYDGWHNHWNDWHDHYHGWYHGHWGGYWNNWAATGAWWVSRWALASVAYNWGYAGYVNPYYVEPAQPVSYMNYAEPVLVPEPAPPAPGQAEPPPPPPPPETASQAFDAARAGFRSGDYRTALLKVEQALKDFPQDPVAHEFRALVLFAMGDYRGAAAAVNAVLAGGPGWDWTTMSSLYDDVETYKKQFKALQDAAAAKPNDPAVHFLLAYHCLTAGLTSAAETELQIVTKLQPKDVVSARLLGAMAGDEEKPEEPGKPAPAEEKLPDIKLDIIGSWVATGPDGGSIGLTIKENGKFQWTTNRGAKKTTFGGTFALEDNIMMLERSAGGALTGRVAALANDKFRFRLIGGGEEDPGLTFIKK